MKIDTSQLLSFESYAELYDCTEQPLSRQRVQQLVTEKRLPAIEIAGKKFIHINAIIKPSRKKMGPKKGKKY